MTGVCIIWVPGDLGSYMLVVIIGFVKSTVGSSSSCPSSCSTITFASSVSKLTALMSRDYRKDRPYTPYLFLVTHSKALALSSFVWVKMFSADGFIFKVKSVTDALTGAIWFRLTEGCNAPKLSLASVVIISCYYYLFSSMATLTFYWFASKSWFRSSFS